MERSVSQAEPLLRASGLDKTYASLGAGLPGLEIFRNLSLDIYPAEMVAIVGQSGTGKSSLLHLLAAMDTATAGTIHCGAREVTHLKPRGAATYRNRDIGYVWQFHYLLPEFTAAENVALPLLARGVKRREALSAAEAGLEAVGLRNRAQHRSGELSGGEQQRVSIARALITNPKLLLADEPTGDLDATTAEAVFTLLQRLHRDRNLASVLVTHNMDFASRCDRVLRLRDGILSPA